jgi:hypothetical protein
MSLRDVGGRAWWAWFEGAARLMDVGAEEKEITDGLVYIMHLIGHSDG